MARIPKYYLKPWWMVKKPLGIPKRTWERLRKKNDVPVPSGPPYTKGKWFDIKEGSTDAWWGIHVSSLTKKYFMEMDSRNQEMEV